MQAILHNIKHLSEIRSAYLHYLASYHAQCNVENANYIKCNLKIISESISQLKQLLPSPIYKVSIAATHIYKYSALEEQAIVSFNTDKRFTITE
ncbi:hypothetical protein LRS05_13350 [Flavobacterium sp. J372]|uniref:hypothetical protein n=1 Tax=Flavobacterium sp. J372 TaxID=2898436 RepID=UPI002150761D|nr:hypothetical protein [Flavobacterium sp. J372]MCR5863050.1 hypothetical protein [Flavobacterium sp. J372]